MAGYLSRRLAQLVPVLFLASLIIFFMLRLIPGDPAQILAGPEATPDVVAQVRHTMGLDQPLPVQYGIWLGHVLRGDFGTSYISGASVLSLVAAKFPNTLELAVAGLVLAFVIALPLGVLAAARHGAPPDAVVSGLSALGMGIPNFWLGLLLILLFALELHWLPPGGQSGSLRDLILPALTLAVPEAAVLVRFVRAGILEVAQEPFVRTARAKGLGSDAVLRRHVMPNALIPLVTVAGIQFGRLLGGAVIVESVFAWPGLGRLVVDSVMNKDYAVVQGGLILLVGTFVAINVAIDILYGWIDPRMRYA